VLYSRVSSVRRNRRKGVRSRPPLPKEYAPGHALDQASTGPPKYAASMDG
jgi:hypothetical protein